MDDELSLIDANIGSIRSLALPRTLKSLNLHSNEITKIDGLSHLSLLQHLDLSANRINVIENLDALTVLRTLNLACNNIRRVENLRKLQHLRYLNLSYNAIANLSGVELTGIDQFVSGSPLEILEAHGNLLRNFDQVCDILRKLPHLRHVTFRLDEAGSANPFCDNIPNYRATLLREFPNLVTIDCIARNGMPVDRALFVQIHYENDDEQPDAFSKLRELEQQETEAALPSGSTKSTAGLMLPIRTPHIDAVLQRMRRRAGTAKANAEARAANESDEDADSRSDSTPEVPSHKRKSASPSPRRRQASRSSSRGSTSKSTDRDRLPQKQVSKPRPKPAGSKKRNQAASASASASAGNPKGPEDPELVSGFPFGPSNGSSLSSGAVQKGRTELRTTFERVLHELSTERDRRRKLERACRRLVDELISSTRDANPDVRRNAETDNDPEGDLIEAHRAILKLRASAEEYRAQYEENFAQCNALRDAVAKRDEAIDELRDNGVQLRAELGRQEAAFTKQLASEARRANEAQARAQALSREIESVRAQHETLTRELSETRSLMMKREAEFEQTLARRIEPSSAEFEKLVGSREQAVVERFQRECDSLNEKLVLSGRRYVELEDEFRDALRFEEARYVELEDAHKTLIRKFEEASAELRSLREREAKHAETIKELSSFAKEARVRLEEASRSKAELVRDYRERNEALEAHLEEATKRVAALEALRGENATLRSRILAADSLVDGLRNERKAWSAELARQGTALAQDRGKLEAQIESLTKQLSSESDSVKIKTKIIEDQTDTIQKLKAGLAEKDAEIKRVQREALAVQREAEQRASAAEERCETIIRDAASARARKSELKQRCADLTAELDAQREKHEDFVARWRSKSNALADLESRVEQLTSEHADRLASVISERDDALSRLRSLDDAFRKQLDAKEAFNRDQIETMRRERDDAIAAADERVARAEAEMRELLIETERTKRTMEAKLGRLQSAVGELFDLGRVASP